MRLRLGRSALLLAAGLAVLAPLGCAKPVGPPNKSPEEIKANEIRRLENMLLEDIEIAKKEGKTPEQIEAIKARYRDEIEKLKNPPPIPPAEQPVAEPSKKDS
ncbi:MAG: hypothetical protein U0746_13420 [Gemmataceae bacterium]